MASRSDTFLRRHLHADFVSGHQELAARTGAKIYMGAQAGATFPHVPVSDGFELKFGKASIRVLETPGHTPESICLVVTDEEKSASPWAVLTGDTLVHRRCRTARSVAPRTRRRNLRACSTTACTTSC